jgi:hypothetical protein
MRKLPFAFVGALAWGASGCDFGIAGLEGFEIGLGDPGGFPIFSVTVAGTIEDPQGQPVDSMSVSMFPGYATDTTESDGSYSMSTVYAAVSLCQDVRIVFLKGSHQEERHLGECGTHELNLIWNPGGVTVLP